MNLKSISATSYNTYEQCPLLWKFKYLYKLIEPENPAFVIGTAYHKCLELFYKGESKDSIIEKIKEQLMPNKTKNEINQFALVRKMFDKYLEYPFEDNTLETEKKFKLDISSVLNVSSEINLIGFIDRITVNYIVDYKTTSEDYTLDTLQSNIQSDIYSYIRWKQIGTIPPIIYHIMNKKKCDKKGYTPQALTIQKTEEDMAILEQKLRTFYDNILNERFECKKSNSCFWCPFKSFCPC